MKQRQQIKAFKFKYTNDKTLDFIYFAILIVLDSNK